MIAKRVMVDGRVQISVNGRILSPSAFMTYYPNERNFKQFREIGTPFFSFGAYSTDYGINDYAGIRPFGPHFHIGENQFDFTEIDRILELIAPGGAGAYIFPRVYVDCPRWWAEKHPEELCEDNRGERLRESFASMPWRENAWSAMRALIDHVNASPWRECVVGYHIAAGSTEEWTYHHHSDLQYRLDYSEPNRQYFIRWLQEKYQSIELLNAAWHKKYACFQEVTFPTQVQRLFAQCNVLRDAKNEMQTIDFWEYSSWLFADTIIYFGEKIKKYTHDSVLTGAFYGYVMMLTRSEKSHFALHKVLSSPYIDFIATTHGGGGPGHGWPYASAIDSIRLHGKLFFSEGDVRTHLTRPFAQTLPQSEPNAKWYFERSAWKPLDNQFLSLSALKKACLRDLTGQTGVWWFDMFGGWFDSPEIMQLFKRFNHWSSEQTLGPIKPDVAVILDESGLQQLARVHTPAEAVIDRQRMLMDWIGAPYHIYLAEDLAEDNFPVEDYKLYIMLNFVRPSDRVRCAIQDKVKRGGRTLVWSYLTDVDRKGELTDFETGYDPADSPMRAVYRSDKFGCTVYPEEAVSCPRFSARSREGAYALAFFENTAEPAVLCKVADEYTSVYSLLPAMPPELLSSLILLSNAHLFSYTGDVIFAGGQFVGIHARTAGYKRIYLPFSVKEMTDAESGEPVPLYDNIFADLTMQEYETKIFRIKR